MNRKYLVKIMQKDFMLCSFIEYIDDIGEFARRRFGVNVKINHTIDRNKDCQILYSMECPLHIVLEKRNN